MSAENTPYQGVDNPYWHAQYGLIDVNCSTKASLDAALQAKTSIGSPHASELVLSGLDYILWQLGA